MLFRAADAGLLRFFLQSLGRHTDSKVPPTRRGRSRLHSKPPARYFHSSSATPVHCPCRAEVIFRRRPMAIPGLSTPPGARRLPSLRTLPTSVDCVLSIASPEHFWPRLRCSALRLKTAAVFGSIDCSLRLYSASATPPSLSYGGMALHSVCNRKLSLATPFRLSPTPLLRHGFVPPTFHRQPETSACYSGPSMPCRRTPSSGRREPTISALYPAHLGNCHCHSIRRLTFHYTRRAHRGNRPWHIFHLSPRTECRRLRLSTPPGTWLLQWHLTAHYVSRSHPQS